jgi:hypothetical protein
MTRRQSRIPLVRLAVVLSALIGAAVLGCNTVSVRDAPDCRGTGCTCEEDPTQPTCRAYNGAPEGGTHAPSDAAGIEGDGEADAGGDAPSDGPDDAG